MGKYSICCVSLKVCESEQKMMKQFVCFRSFVLRGVRTLVYTVIKEVLFTPEFLELLLALFETFIIAVVMILPVNQAIHLK